MTPASVDGGPVPKNPYEPPEGLAGHGDPCQLCVYGCPRRAWKEGFDAARPTGDAPPCRCGSGAHPRRCEVHPHRYDMHRAELTIESLTEELEHVQSRDAALREEGRVQERARLMAGLQPTAEVLLELRPHLTSIAAGGDMSITGRNREHVTRAILTALRDHLYQPDASQGSARPGGQVNESAPLPAINEGRGPGPAAPQGSPLPGAAVPRGHCNRCERCGWKFGQPESAGCWPSNCSMRPMPPPRIHCAGCGAIFDDVVTPGAPPEGGALEGELAEALRELTDIVQGILDGEDGPDSFTLQPARALLARYDAHGIFGVSRHDVAPLLEEIERLTRLASQPQAPGDGNG